MSDKVWSLLEYKDDIPDWFRAACLDPDMGLSIVDKRLLLCVEEQQAKITELVERANDLTNLLNESLGRIDTLESALGWLEVEATK